MQRTMSWSCYGITARLWCRVRITVPLENPRRRPETPTMPPPPVLPNPGRFDRSSTISINISSCKKAKWLPGFTIQSTTTTTYLRWIRLSAPISSTRRPPLTTARPCKLSPRLSSQTTAPCPHRLDLQFRCRDGWNRRRRTSRTSPGTTQEPTSRAWRWPRRNPQWWIRARRRPQPQRRFREFRKLWGTRWKRRKEAPELRCLRRVAVAVGARWCATWLWLRRRAARVVAASRFRWRRRKSGSGRVGRRRDGSLRARWVNWIDSWLFLWLSHHIIVPVYKLRVRWHPLSCAGWVTWVYVSTPVLLHSFRCCGRALFWYRHFHRRGCACPRHVCGWPWISNFCVHGNDGRYF